MLVQNFRPGTIAKMGFSYDVLKSLNPKIVMVNVSAYGQFGPYTKQIGFDPIGQVMSGIAMVTGQEGMPPIRAGVPIIDRITALHSAIGTLAALRERDISGRVCRALGRPEWEDDDRFNTRHGRGENRQVINERVNELLEELEMKEAIQLFTDNDVVAAAVNTIPMAAEDPHPWERRAMVEVDDFLAGSIAVSGDFWHFSRTPAVIGTTPKVGEHNKEIIMDLLDYSESDYKQLMDDEVIAEWDLYESIPGAYRN